MKKKITWMLTAALLSCTILAGCSKKDTSKEDMSAKKSSMQSTVSEDKKFQVVTTIFPEYDWVKEIVGEKADRFEFTNLFDKGVDLHSYQPTAEDIAKISDGDLFIYVGGASDGWAENAVKDASNKNLQAVNLLETLGSDVKNEEVVEGMEHSHGHHDHDHDKEDKHDDHDHNHDHDKEDEHEDHDHNHDHDKEDKHDDHDHNHDHDKEDEHEDHDHNHDHDKEDKHDDHDHDHGHDHHHHENEKDEHVWLSLKHAVRLVNEISKRIQSLDPENKEIYVANTEKYIAKLTELDKKFEETVKNASKKTVLFGDRFPFRYLVDDYHLDYYAAFSGCSAETEASFETVAFLAKKTDELGLSKVLVIEKSNDKIAKTIIGNTDKKDQEILVLNSMQSVTEEEIKNGLTYLSVMENNLKTLESSIK